MVSENCKYVDGFLFVAEQKFILKERFTRLLPRKRELTQARMVEYRNERN